MILAMLGTDEYVEEMNFRQSVFIPRESHAHLPGAGDFSQ